MKKINKHDKIIVKQTYSNYNNRLPSNIMIFDSYEKIDDNETCYVTTKNKIGMFHWLVDTKNVCPIPLK